MKFCFAVLLIPSVTFAHSFDEHLDEYAKILKSEDARNCVEISESYLIGECFLRFAQDTNDPTACLLNPNKAESSECRALIIGDESACEGLQAEEAAHCFTTLARQNGDVRLCEKFDAGVHFLERCILETAAVQVDSSLCTRIADRPGGLRDDCYRRVAISAKDPDKCKDIQGSSPLESCYRDTAEALADPSICQRIANKQGGRFMSCIVRSALAAENPSACDVLEAEDAEECKAHIQASLFEEEPTNTKTGKSMPTSLLAIVAVLIAGGVWWFPGKPKKI